VAALKIRKIVLVYHNVTLTMYYLDSFPDFLGELSWGHQGLRYLLPHVDVVVVVSEYNA
jgi:hypothetical protein